MPASINIPYFDEIVTLVNADITVCMEFLKKIREVKAPIKLTRDLDNFVKSLIIFRTAMAEIDPIKGLTISHRELYEKYLQRVTGTKPDSKLP